VPRFALSALRGFTGVAKGGAIEHLFDTRLWGMTVGETQFPITTIAYNMDLSRVRQRADARADDRRARADGDRAASVHRGGEF
jgi:hypothetical protein